MTVALKRPVDQHIDPLLKTDIQFLVSNLDRATYDVARHTDDKTEYILIDTRSHHHQIKFTQESITLLKYRYSSDGSLSDEQEQEIIMLPQFVALLEG